MAARGVKFELRKLKRWSTTMMYDSFFATQYKNCFVFFGIPTGTSVAKEVDEVCTMGGCVTTLVEVDSEDGYIWSAMPHLSIQLLNAKLDKHIQGGLQICGGYTCREEIKVFGIVKHSYQLSRNDYTTKCWTTSLEIPFSKWSEIATSIESTATQEVKMPSNFLAAVQKCQQYVIYFYLPKHYRRSWVIPCSPKGYHPFSESVLIVNDEENKRSCLFLTNSVTFDGHVSSAVVGADLFILSGDKMAKVEKFTHLLVASAANTDQNTKFSISFDLTVPHANSTLFVVQDTLCVVGGCDDNCEPFSDIYQFDQSSQEWNECGVSSVSRYAASVVTFTDRNQKEGVFIAGGFKGKDVPCSIIELLSIK